MSEPKSPLMPGASDPQKDPLVIESKLVNAYSLEDIYEILRGVGTVEGSQRAYPAEELIGMIKEVAAGSQEVTLEHITNTYGLRAAVKNVLEIEKQKRELFGDREDK